MPFGFLPCQQTSENFQATDDVTKHMFPNLGFHVHSVYIFYHFFMSKPVFTLKRLHFQHMSNSHHMSSRCCALPPRGNFDATDVLFVTQRPQKPLLKRPTPGMTQQYLQYAY